MPVDNAVKAFIFRCTQEYNVGCDSYEDLANLNQNPGVNSYVKLLSRKYRFYE